jgi:hypothetical protein
MYRVIDSSTPTEAAKDLHYEANIKGWQKLTSFNIPADDINEIVYSMSLNDFTKFANGKLCKCKNKFARWIKNDKELLDYLLLAKTNEFIRAKHNSRWYYPTMRTDAPMTLEQVAEKAEAYKGERLRSRYLLQAVRALFTLGQYEKCISLYSTHSTSLMTDSAMHQSVLSYIAGAKARTGNTEEAEKFFAQNGDLESLQACAKYRGDSIPLINAIEMAAMHNPYSPSIASALQELMRKAELLAEENPWEIYEYYQEIKDQDLSDWDRTALDVDPHLPKIYSQLYDLSIKLGNNPNVRNKALWHYTAATIAKLRVDKEQALRLAIKAENAEGDPVVKESAKVLHIWLDAQFSNCDASYDTKLMHHIQWLEQKLVKGIGKYNIQLSVENISKMNRSISFYYWNDMMRCVLLGTVCPKMLKQGRHTRALQLANMAENRLFQIIDSITVEYWTYDDESTWTHKSRNMLIHQYRNPNLCNGPEYKSERMSFKEYRYSRFSNEHDYKNNFFAIIDCVGLDKAIAYTNNVQNPRSQTDKYLNSRGYTNPDYLYDIIGTQCLRNMRYDEAVKYLGKVSPAYRHHQNVDRIDYNPFALEEKENRDQNYFRFEFAREMASLKQSIQTTEEPNQKALLMIRYATGLRSSFLHCWELTQYFKGDPCEGGAKKKDWRKTSHTNYALDEAERIYTKALNMFTDKQIAAEQLYKTANYKTLAEKYPDTHYGNIALTKCDRLVDYHAHKNKHPYDYNYY